MSEPVPARVDQPIERAAYVPPPATLPMPAAVAEHPPPEHPTPELPVLELVRPASAQPAPPVTGAASTVLVPAGAASRKGARRLATIGAVVLVLLIGLGIGIGLRRASDDRPEAATVAGPPAETATLASRSPIPSVAIATTVPAPPPPAPTAAASDRPVTPEQALTLTDQQAMDELHLEMNESASQVAGLVGTWVPQVSSKCVGISVDIGPDWVADGVDETVHVTLQQIVAFHISLHNRFGAVTLLPTQAGIPRNQATSGPCAGETTWMSIVPQRFADADGANAWCDVNVPPVRECAARYVAGPGERSKLRLRP
ncbi:hypothetical protein [Luedemannella helvata]|uniref:Uncharacterized protein n=1 Tax=Luedemannella helvata TaxID=349315 RepID=A0ABP4VZE7_9ACTN